MYYPPYIWTIQPHPKSDGCYKYSQLSIGLAKIIYYTSLYIIYCTRGVHINKSISKRALGSDNSLPRLCLKNLKISEQLLCVLQKIIVRSVSVRFV